MGKFKLDLKPLRFTAVECGCAIVPAAVRHGYTRYIGIDAYYPGSFGDSYYGRGGMAYSDERILAQVGFPEYLLFDLQPESLSGEIHFRHPSLQKELAKR